MGVGPGIKQIARSLPLMIAISGLLGIVLAATPASAQIAPTREEIQRGLRDVAPQADGQTISVDTEFERAPCPLADPQFADVRFTLSTVSFGGPDIIDRSLLTPAFSDYIGSENPVAIICDIRDRAATILRAQGYLAAVQVPPQSIKDGNVQLDILAAKIVRTQIRGDAGASERILARYVQKIADQPIFNIPEAERYLLLMRDIPGLDVRLALRPANAGPGEVIGEFSVIGTPIFADLAVQNLGTRAVGRFGILNRIRINGLTGLGDQTTLSLFSTLDFEEQQVLQIGHDFKLGSEGLNIGADFTYSWSEPSVGIGGLIDSETLVANVDASYPFIRSQAKNLSGTLGFEYIDQDVEFADTLINEDTLSIIYARLDYDQISASSISGRDGYSAAEPRWAFAANIEFRQGIDIFGASPGCGPGFALCLVPGAVLPSRLEADATEFVFRGAVQFDYRPDPQWTFSLAPRVQYAPNPLLSYEEYSGGNYTVGRGFDPGVIIGDSGVGFRSEVRYGSLIPKDRQSSAIQPFAFFDAAWVWNEDSDFNGIDPQELYSLGAGVRANLRNQATLDALVAVPLNATGFQTETGDVRFLFTFSAQLAPWNIR